MRGAAFGGGGRSWMSRYVLPILVVLALVLRPAVARGAESGAAGPPPPAPAAVQRGQDEEPPPEPAPRRPAPAVAPPTVDAEKDAGEDADEDAPPPPRHGNLSSWKWGAVLGAGAA